MELALAAAWPYQGLTYPNPAVGAVVVRDGAVLGMGAHVRAGEPHAEVVALRAALLFLRADLLPCFPEDLSAAQLHRQLRTYAGELFRGAAIYVTLEPCAHHGRTPPCADLIADLGLHKVIVGMMDPNVQAAGGCARLQTRGIAVESGICEEECRDLLEPFMRWQNGQFTFFKLAQTLNGVMTGGIISGQGSRSHMHALRSVADRLVIGGGTVRADRPMLDSRLAGGRAPDVTIYTRHDDFDRTIPLFGVTGREVAVTDDLDSVRGGMVMIEGGEGMLRATADTDLWYLIYTAPRWRDEAAYRLNRELRIMASFRIGDDLVLWACPKTPR